MTPRRFVAAVGALALVVAACTDSATPSTSPPPTTAVTSTSVADPPIAATATTAPTVTTTSLPPGVTPEIAEAVKAQIDELIAVTEEVRGLRFIEQPDVQIVTAEELARMVREELVEEQGDLEVIDRLFTLLGILDPEVDLVTLFTDLLAEQVLGFYDGDTRELVVASADAELTATDKLTVVHELIHALTDQHFLFHDKLVAYEDEQQFDELAALVALVEGDATYFELVYLLEHLTFAEQLSVAQSLTDIDTAVFDASPEFLKADLAFPYETGYRFVEQLVSEGGIRAVDDAYLTPPVSTEQIIHPERYFGGEPVLEVDAAPVSLAGYELYEESSFGEWGLELLFIDGDGRGLAAQLGDGWGGDVYQVFTFEDELVFVWEYRADREQDAVEVAEALIRLARDRMGLGDGVEADGGLLFENEEAFAFVDRVGDELLFLAASDPAVGADLRVAIIGGA